MAIVVPGLLVGLLLTGGVYAATPDTYEGGWYRLFPECDFDALKDVAARADQDPDAIVITGDWQSKLVVAALVDNGGRVWFMSNFFTSPQSREENMQWMEDSGRPVLVVADQYLKQMKGANATFLESDPWVRMDAGTCAEGAGKVRAYESAWSLEGREE